MWVDGEKMLSPVVHINMFSKRLNCQFWVTISAKICSDVLDWVLVSFYMKDSSALVAKKVNIFFPGWPWYFQSCLDVFRDLNFFPWYPGYVVDLHHGHVSKFGYLSCLSIKVLIQESCHVTFDSGSRPSIKVLKHSQDWKCHWYLEKAHCWVNIDLWPTMFKNSPDCNNLNSWPILIHAHLLLDQYWSWSQIVTGLAA